MYAAVAGCRRTRDDKLFSGVSSNCLHSVKLIERCVAKLIRLRNSFVCQGSRRRLSPECFCKLIGARELSIGVSELANPINYLSSFLFTNNC